MGTSENKLSYDLLKIKVTTRLMYFITNRSTLVGSLCTQLITLERENWCIFTCNWMIFFLTLLPVIASCQMLHC